MKISTERLKELITEEIANINEEDGSAEEVLNIVRIEPESRIHIIVKALRQIRAQLMYPSGEWRQQIPPELEIQYESVMPQAIKLSTETTYQMLFDPLLKYFKELEKEKETKEESETEE